MFDTLSDTSLGLLLLAVFMPVVFGAGYVLYRFRNARLDLAWRPLLPLFTEVRTAGDGGGGAASFLRGRYRDRTFEATMWPAVSVYGSIALDSGGQPRFNLFELRLLDVQGSGDWSVSLRHAAARETERAWTLDAECPRLAAALLDAGALRIVATLVIPDYTLVPNGPVLAFQHGQSRLVLRCDAHDDYVPSVEWVGRALEALLRLAELNGHHNATAQPRAPPNTRASSHGV